MAASTITYDDAVKIHAALTAKGKPIPPELQKAVDDGAPAAPTSAKPTAAGGPKATPAAGSTRRPAPARPPAPAAEPAPATAPPTETPTEIPTKAAPAPAPAPAPRAPRPPARRPSRSRRPAPRGRSKVARSFRSLISSPATLGGNSGGLLLGLIAYPLVLSVLQHGAAGPGLWLRAKFLNQGPSSGGTLGQLGNLGPQTPSNIAPGGTLTIPPAMRNPGADTTPVPPASPRPPFTRYPGTPPAPSGARGGSSVPRAV
jgi:hypothetical protein